MSGPWHGNVVEIWHIDYGATLLMKVSTLHEEACSCRANAVLVILLDPSLAVLGHLLHGVLDF